MPKHRQPSTHRKASISEQQDDAFVASAMAFSQWANKNRRLLVFIGIGAVLLIVSGVEIVTSQRSLAIQAVNDLEVIHQTISLSAFEDAKVQLNAYLERFEGHEKADEALVMLGRLHLESGDPAVAINVLERGGLSLNDGLGVQGNSLLARAYEDQGRWSDAESLYLEIADRAKLAFQVRDALSSAARIRHQQNDIVGALEIYELILDNFESDDMGRGIYELRFSEMREVLGGAQ